MIKKLDVDALRKDLASLCAKHKVSVWACFSRAAVMPVDAEDQETKVSAEVYPFLLTSENEGAILQAVHLQAIATEMEESAILIWEHLKQRNEVYTCVPCVN